VFWCLGRHCCCYKTVIKLLEILVINYYGIFNGLRSMPAKAGCLVTGLSWIRTQREVLPLTTTWIWPKYSGQNRLPTNWCLRPGFLLWSRTFVSSFDGVGKCQIHSRYELLSSCQKFVNFLQSPPFSRSRRLLRSWANHVACLVEVGEAWRRWPSRRPITWSRLSS